MTRGFRAALWFDAGVVASDALIITGISYFASWINEAVIRNDYFGIAGGLVFMAFGVNYIFSGKQSDSSTASINNNLKVFMNGFFINLMNPSVIIFWMGTMAVSITNFVHNGKETLLYYASALTVMAGIDVVKAYFAYRISSLIHTSVIRFIHIISGVALIGLGIWFMVTG